jgi:hypothetical protein
LISIRWVYNETKSRVHKLSIFYTAPDEQVYDCFTASLQQLQSPGFDPTAPGFDIEITSYPDKITITSS